MNVAKTSLQHHGVIIEKSGFFKNLAFFVNGYRGMRINWKAITPPEYLPSDRQAIEDAINTGACRSYEKEYVLATALVGFRQLLPMLWRVVPR